MRDDQIEYMVQRFLGWKLPDTFNPDGGICFERTVNKGGRYERENQPIGTNLLGYEEARAMVLHMIDGMPEPQLPLRLRVAQIISKSRDDTQANDDKILLDVRYGKIADAILEEVVTEQ